MKEEKKIRILMCGGALKGNLGAPAMYDSIIDELRKYLNNIEVTILSKYPNDDREECASRGYRMIEYPTINQLVKGGSFYIFAELFKKLHFPYRWLAKDGSALDAYFQNDILIDASGISFSDDRSLSNIMINTLWFLPGIISGIPMVKVSQSMGPYGKWYVRKAAKLVFDNLDFLVCRGDKSYDYTRGFFKSKNIYNLPDTAFCLRPTSGNEKEKLLNKYDVCPGDYIAVGPSFVMRDYFDKGVYSDIISQTLNELAHKTGLKLLFVPHSWLHKAQIGADTVNDDLSVCNEIADKLNSHCKFRIVNEELSARDAKALIGDSYMAIGSRYHFLIAALSSEVPSMALGWSHKYRELFKEFEIDDYVLEYGNMNRENVCNMTIRLFENRENVSMRIKRNLDRVKNQSAQNELLIVELMKEKGLV